MKDIKFNSKSLIKLQDYSWYFLFLYFLLATCAYLFDFALPIESGYVGVLIVLVITLIKLILIAEQFRKIRLVRFTYIAYLLLLILFITILVRLFL